VEALYVGMLIVVAVALAAGAAYGVFTLIRGRS
jgi:hypothetical protein